MAQPQESTQKQQIPLDKSNDDECGYLSPPPKRTKNKGGQVHLNLLACRGGRLYFQNLISSSGKNIKTQKKYTENSTVWKENVPWLPFQALHGASFLTCFQR